MTDDGDQPVDPGEGPDRVSDDLGQAEVIESAGMQNSVAVAGPAALLMAPLASVLVALKKRFRRG